jgi:hypothetical protein
LGFLLVLGSAAALLGQTRSPIMALLGARTLGRVQGRHPGVPGQRGLERRPFGLRAYELARPFRFQYQAVRRWASPGRRFLRSKPDRFYPGCQAVQRFNASCDGIRQGHLALHARAVRTARSRRADVAAHATVVGIPCPHAAIATFDRSSWTRAAVHPRAEGGWRLRETLTLDRCSCTNVAAGAAIVHIPERYARAVTNLGCRKRTTRAVDATSSRAILATAAAMSSIRAQVDALRTRPDKVLTLDQR